ncbi:methylated-DNA--protein-cysteine methyltransferase isoform X2 [Sciurus carolinensis]|uniref:methylated-DNA--protein-cysteine methyltransferase isoform X2 n=1 Tax=Sciurus carolinensis TaxID=30640 RepID=UPI001FB1A768|nr:methylated-DNA--protein-cysteine methyltransferase isoform X2 [Sciurus carolinensis]
MVCYGRFWTLLFQMLLYLIIAPPPGLDRQALGRMDMACVVKLKVLESPLGKIELSGCDQGLHGIRLLSPETSSDPEEAPATPEVLSGPEETSEPLMQCAAWLDAYFHKPTAIEGLPLPALHHPVFQKDSFTRQVLWKLLKVVKFGEMVSYQQLAALAGNPRAARAVGGAMRTNPVPILIPCHRVVCSSGALGNYSGGRSVKEWLLAHEAVQAGKPAYWVSSQGGTCLGAAGSTSGSQRAGRN